MQGTQSHGYISLIIKEDVSGARGTSGKALAADVGRSLGFSKDSWNDNVERIRMVDLANIVVDSVDVVDDIVNSRDGDIFLVGSVEVVHL